MFVKLNQAVNSKFASQAHTCLYFIHCTIFPMMTPASDDLIRYCVRTMTHLAYNAKHISTISVA